MGKFYKEERKKLKQKLKEVNLEIARVENLNKDPDDTRTFTMMLNDSDRYDHAKVQRTYIKKKMKKMKTPEGLLEIVIGELELCRKSKRGHAKSMTQPQAILVDIDDHVTKRNSTLTSESMTTISE